MTKQIRAKTIHLSLVTEENPPPIPKSPRPSPPQQKKRYSAISLPLPTEPPQTQDVPLPKKRTLTLSSKPTSNSDDYHRRTATLPLPSKTNITPHQEAAYMEVVVEKEIETADTAALVVVEEQTASQEIPQIYDDIGDLKREDSPDLTQFDDIITPAKSLPHTQDDVYI